MGEGLHLFVQLRANRLVSYLSVLGHVAEAVLTAGAYRSRPLGNNGVGG